MLKNPHQLIALGAILFLLLLGSWKFLLPKSTPTEVAPPGSSARMTDAP